jgi:hypothetical protein
MNFQDDNSNISGIFGVVAYSDIYNLNLSNTTIYSNEETGILCGNATYSNFQNCSVSGNIIINKHTNFVGGLVGSIRDGSITQCSSMVNFNVDKKFSNTIIAGIVGSLFSSELTNSFFRGNIPSKNIGTAQLVSVCLNSTIENCYANLNKISSINHIFIVGMIIDSKISNNYWATKKIIKKNKVSKNFVGKNDVSSNFGVSNKKLKKKRTYINWDFDNLWNIKQEINDGFPFYGDGVLGNY